MAIFDEPSRKTLPATPELTDHRAAVIKGAISSIPVLGGVLAEELGLILAPPLARRREEWFADLARRLYDLENSIDGFKFDDLSNNEQFVSATLQATQAALRTHQQEKLEALRNAVLNTALGDGGDDDRRAIFLSLVDTLTPLHLRILKSLDKNDKLPTRTAFSTLVGNVTQQTKSMIDSRAVKLLIEDLSRAGLLQRTENQEYVVALEGRWTSAWGHEFLTFITAPKETKNAK